MSNVKISALPSATTPLAGTEQVPIVQSGATVKVAVSDLTAGRSIEASQVDITAQGDLRLQDSTGGEYVGFQAPATLGSSYILTMPTTDGNSGEALVTDGSGVLSWSFAASGDVYGPASSTDNALARFDSTTGKIIQNSVGILSDAGALSGLTGLSSTSGTFSTTLGVTGVATFTAQPILSSLTASSAVATDASKGLVSVTNTGTGNNVLATNPTLTLANATGLPLTTGVTGTLPVGNGGTGATTLTLNGVVYGNGTSAAGITAAGTTGQVLIATTSGAPSWGSVPSTAAVTSISFDTTGLTPATATTGAVTVAGTLVAVNGGTGQSSYAVGDLLYASTTTALSKLADVATGNALISGGVGVAPSWGKIALTTHVSGTLPVANGGTGIATLTAGYIPYGAGTSAFGSSANLFWDSTNSRLGIGTTSPSQKLQVVGNALISSGGWFGFGDADERISADNTGFMQFFVNASERIRIDSSGNVGIATTSPTQKLQVAGNVLAANAGWFGFGDADERIVGDNTGSLQFFVSGSERMRIDSAGSVSINASSASIFKFNVVGGAIFSGWVGSGTATANSIAIGNFTSVNRIVTYGADTATKGQFSIVGATTDSSSSAEYLRIDTSGNLGLGVTPSAWGSGYKAIQFGNTSSQVSALFSNGTNNSWYVSNSFFDGTNFKYVATGASTAYSQFNGTHTWKYVASGTAGNNITYTDAMTLDASGNLGLGTSSVNTFNMGMVIFGGATDARLSLRNNTTGNTASDGFQIYTSSNDAYIEQREAASLIFNTNTIERMRIDSSGNVLIGKTSATANGGDLQVSSGITFPATQVAKSDANTLDDYEEGTWTPTFTSTGLTVTQSTSNGKYTKVGGLVTATFYIQVTAVSGTLTNGLFINNLPFATTSGAEYGYSSAIGVHQFSLTPGMFIAAGATRLTIYQLGTVTAFTGASLNNGFYLGTVTYLVV